MQLSQEILDKISSKLVNAVESVNELDVQEVYKIVRIVVAAYEPHHIADNSPYPPEFLERLQMGLHQLQGLLRHNEIINTYETAQSFSEEMDSYYYGKSKNEYQKLVTAFDEAADSVQEILKEGK